jgi:uncharacterized protein (TIGR02266 family)
MPDSSNGSKAGLEPVAKRVPIERKIDLRFPNFEGLITRISANLSTTGMFVQSDTPRPPGTEFDFSIRIEEWSPIQGTAQVVWTRGQTESPERPAGMGVKFTDLDAQSRRMIRWLVDKHQQEGGKPFDVDRVPAGASKYGPGSPVGEGLSRAARPGQTASGPGQQPAADEKPSRGFWFALAAILLIVAGYVGFKTLLEHRAERSRLGGSPAATAPASPDSEITESSDSASAASLEPVTQATTEAVSAFVRVWSSAWEGRDAEAVKALYSDTFDGGAYGSRQAWQQAIDERLRDSEYIRVAVSALEIDFPSAETATATFYRSWRSNTGDETQRIRLELVPIGDSWRIESEVALD